MRHDLRREHPHLPWLSLTSLRLTTDEFDKESENDFGLCRGLGGELF